MRISVQTILNILNFSDVHPEKPVTIIFLDVEKAFDNVSWQIINMDLGSSFINAIATIYHKQKAKIIVNSEMTGNVDIEKGTRQGCPLLLLIFILVKDFGLFSSFLFCCRQNRHFVYICREWI